MLSPSLKTRQTQPYPPVATSPPKASAPRADDRVTITPYGASVASENTPLVIPNPKDANDRLRVEGPRRMQGRTLVNDLRQCFDVMLQRYASESVWPLLCGFQTVHHALRQRGLVQSDDATPLPQLGAWCGASHSERTELLVQAMIRRVLDAREASLRYYGLPVRSPGYSDINEDPAASLQACYAPEALEEVKSNAHVQRAAEGCTQVWPAPRTHFSIDGPIERSVQHFDVLTNFLPGDEQGPRGPVTFCVPLLALRIDAAGTPYARVEDLLADVPLTHAERGASRWTRDDCAVFRRLS